MGSIKPLQEQLMKALAAELGSHGFKFIRRSQRYYRVTGYGKDMIHITFSHPGSGFVAELSADLRHDAVEDLLQSVPNEWPTEDWKPWTWTVGNRLSNMLRRQAGWHVVQEVDVVEAVMGMMSTVHSVVFPYFARFSSLDEVFAMLVRRDAEARRLTGWGVGPVWAARAVATAFLVNKQDVVDEVERAQRMERAQRHVSIDLNAQDQFFDAVVAEVRHRWRAMEQTESGNATPACHTDAGSSG